MVKNKDAIVLYTCTCRGLLRSVRRIIARPAGHNNCERSELSGLFNGPDFIYVYIYFRQAVRRVVNFLNVSTCILLSTQCDIPQCKYKHTKRKRNRLNELAQYTIAAAYVEHVFARPMLASY